MGILIGMDEAGYGPNLGPLVISATAWEVPDDPRKFDLWQAFAGIVEQTAPRDGEHLQIADSKVVYSPGRGFEHLEAGVLAAMDLLDRRPRTFAGLCGEYCVQPPRQADGEPWFLDADLELPCARNSNLVAAWINRCREGGIRLRSIRSDIVLTQRFNAETEHYDSKGRALSEWSMQIIRRVLEDLSASPHEPILILADKHGGRNRYHDLLPTAFGDTFIACLAESGESSRYRVGKAEIRFETKSERHLPVALASMVCKYVRELSMVLFNRFWNSHLPDLKPTAGYPLDARRFRNDITATQKKLGIPDQVLWRER